MTEPKLPSAPSPAGETASEECATCGHPRTHHRLLEQTKVVFAECSHMLCRCKGFVWKPLVTAVPEPVPTEDNAADDYRPNIRSLSNAEVRATGILAGGAVQSIARELLERRVAAPIAPAAEELRDPNYVHMKILRGEIALTKAQAIHIAGLPADVEERLKPAASPVAGVLPDSATQLAERIVGDVFPSMDREMAVCYVRQTAFRIAAWAAAQPFTRELAQPSAEGDGK